MPTEKNKNYTAEFKAKVALDAIKGVQPNLPSTKSALSVCYAPDWG